MRTGRDCRAKMDKLIAYRTKLQNKNPQSLTIRKRNLAAGKVRRYGEDNRTQKAAEIKQGH